MGAGQQGNVKSGSLIDPIFCKIMDYEERLTYYKQLYRAFIVMFFGVGNRAQKSGVVRMEKLFRQRPVAKVIFPRSIAQQEGSQYKNNQKENREPTDQNINGPPLHQDWISKVEQMAKLFCLLLREELVRG